MPKLTLLPALTIALLWIASPALAVDWDLETFKRHSSTEAWEGYDVGTSFTKKSTQNTPMGARVNETRETLVKVEADKFTIQVENKSSMTGMKWSEGVTKTQKRKKDVKFEMKDAGAEAVTVGGQTYECKKVIGIKTEDGKSETLTFWVHDKHGVVQFASKPDARMPQTVTLAASRLSVDKKIGEHAFKCREFTGSMMGGTFTLLIALNAPERTLAMSMDMEQGGMKITSSQEVTAVTIQKAASK